MVAVPGWPVVIVGTDTRTIWAIDLETGEFDDLGASEAFPELTISPDGRALVIGAGGELNLGVNIDDKIIELSHTGLAAGGARFSPDGGAIAYTVNDGGSQSIWYREFGFEPLPTTWPVPEDGVIVGASLDGEWDLYATPDPTTTGCEGEGLAYRLWRTSTVDGQAVIEPVVTDSDTSFGRPPNYVRGPDGQVALVDSCEEEWIQVGRETADGRIERLRPARPAGYEEYSVQTIRWDHADARWALSLWNITTDDLIVVGVEADPAGPGDTVEVEPSSPDETADPADPWAPPAGADLTVVMVGHDELLNIRESPGTDSPIVATTLGVLAGGESRWIDDGSVWWSVQFEGDVGWVDSRFVARVGEYDDVTDEVLARSGGIPEAETGMDLAVRAVAALMGDDPEDVELMSPARSLGSGQRTLTVDMIGFADEMARGFRARAVTEATASGETLALVSLELAPICRQDVGSDGRCL